MPTPHYLHELPTHDSSPATHRDTDRHHNVYDMSPLGKACRIGMFDTADRARRFAEKITALHSQVWRFANEHDWNFDLLRAYQARWCNSNKLCLNWR